MVVLMMAIFPHVADAQGAKAKGLSVVVIDPGHGGKDPGALGKTAKEKDVVLAVALKATRMCLWNWASVPT